MFHICLMVLGRLVCSRVYCVGLGRAGVGNSLGAMGETFTAVLNFLFVCGFGTCLLSKRRVSRFCYFCRRLYEPPIGF
jgi:hypothetical protein